MIFYLTFVRWSVWVALTGASALHWAGLAQSDGRRLASFLLTIVRKPSGSTARGWSVSSRRWTLGAGARPGPRGQEPRGEGPSECGSASFPSSRPARREDGRNRAWPDRPQKAESRCSSFSPLNPESRILFAPLPCGASHSTSLGGSGGGVGVGVDAPPGSPAVAPVGPVPTVVGGGAVTGRACGIIRKPDSKSISSSVTAVLKRTRATGT